MKRISQFRKYLAHV